MSILTDTQNIDRYFRNFKHWLHVRVTQQIVKWYFFFFLKEKRYLNIKDYPITVF